MKILFATHAFFPSVGGIETNARVLAGEFTRLGHDVRLVTQTPGAKADDFPYPVIRQPAAKQLIEQMKWCDAFYHHNISLASAWPLLLRNRPWIISHRTWITRPCGRLGWQDRLKRAVLRAATNISISRAIAEHLPVPSHVIGNPYQREVFHQLANVPRDKELVFVGRLVPDKGLEVLLQALVRLKGKGLKPHLTVIGSGPGEATAREFIQSTGLQSQVELVGTKTGRELVYLLNQHRIMVVPSLWNEPFGVVALEGIACGCVVVGSEGGGLKDAIGPCGLTFPNGSDEALARALCELLTDPISLVVYRSAAREHLARHTPDKVARSYLQVFERALQ
ncbi:MAG TPA: glycosyltransferase family 4 protein [Planctomycetota bacterium]|nr:glycosyltransferase family 4 protein [Planctomycetota bacterium]